MGQGQKNAFFITFWINFMEYHSIQFTTISINVEIGIVKILFKYRYFQDLLIDIDINIDIFKISLSISISISIFSKITISISISISIFLELPYRYRYRYRYFSKVSIYRQSIFHIDILTRRRSNKNVFYRCTRGRSNKMCFTGAKKCLFYHFFMECHSIQFTTISINVERGIVKILFKYPYFQDLLIDIDINISQIFLINIDIDIDIFQNHLITIDIDIDIFGIALSIVDISTL